MLNKKPIFIVGFARGGTNILLNLLRSHPDIDSPRGELHQVFHGKPEESLAVKWSKRWRYLPVALWQREDVFSIRKWETRRPLTPRTQAWIDRVLYHERFLSGSGSRSGRGNEGGGKRPEEVSSRRLLCKNLNGLIFLSEQLAEMYHDAVFVALVRNGFAVCEGRKRRGKGLRAAARDYNKGCRRIVEDKKTMPNYHVRRFEDMMAHPRKFLRELYELVGLDIGRVDRVRLETKRVMTSDGTHVYVKGAREKSVVWYGLDEFPSHFRRDVNQNQIARLTEAEKSIILEECSPMLQHFGYM